MKSELLERRALIALTRLTDALSGGAISEKAEDAQRDAKLRNELREAALEQQIQAIENSTLAPEPRPGLKVHVCSLVAKDSPAGKPWMPV